MQDGGPHVLAQDLFGDFYRGVATGTPAAAFDFPAKPDSDIETLTKTVHVVIMTTTAGAYGFDNSGLPRFILPNVDGIYIPVLKRFAPDFVVTTQDGIGLFGDDGRSAWAWRSPRRSART